MAEDKLIFPVGFDLEKGVKEAQSNVDKYLDRIAKAVEKYPISVKLQIDKDGGISSTIKAERQRAAKELTGLKKEMAEINKEWNALSAKDRGGEMGARLMARYRELTQEAKGYTATLGAAVKLEDRLARQREKSANAAAKAAQKTREYNKELQDQDGYLSRLIKRLAVYAGFSAIRTFLTGVRDVTAEFELQRVSLGAIIRDQNRANQLFSEIKSFALKSPLQILDLTKYVKQVAAYRIETDKLFDTTKRLADVSVGLGVDMGRLVLAYGQVKAASYLRAAEIRQFTEAGIPMLELLAEKFTEIQGKAVSTEQVMDLVSKRAVSFSMVEEIFKDMTDAGGMFYNMQEKQAQTLFGMWSKLGDAAAVMYEEIGNVGWVNEGMKAGIGLLESMMRNWRLFAGEIRNLAIVFAVFKVASTAIKWMQVNTVAAATAERQFAAAALQQQAAIASGNIVLKARASMMGRLATWNQRAALSTNLLTVAWNKLKVAMVSWGPMLIIAGLSLLVEKMIYASQQAKALDKELERIGAEGSVNIQKSVYNFQTLADTAVNAADGSKKQREALDELHRTYKDMIPVQDMTIKKLRAMKGNYEQLTVAIREYIAQQTLSTKINTIIQSTNKDIEDLSGHIREKLSKGFLFYNQGESTQIVDIYLSTTQIESALIGIEELAKKTTLNAQEIIQKAFKEYAGVDLTNRQVEAVANLTKSFWSETGAVEALIETHRSQKEAVDNVTSAMAKDVAYFGIYADKYKEVQDELQKTIDAGLKTDDDVVIKKNTYLYDRKVANMQIKSDIEFLKAEMVAAGVEWKDQWVKVVDDVQSDTDALSFMNWDAINKAFRDVIAGENVSDAVVLLQRRAGKIQNAYNGLVPSKDVVKAVQGKFRELAAGMKLSMDDVKQYIINSDGDVEEYVKKLEGDLKDIAIAKNDIALIEKNREAGIDDGEYAPTDEELEKLNDAEKLIRAMLKYLVDYRKTSGGGGGSDTRLQTLNEIERTLTAINTKYEELVKKEGKTAALDYVKKNYASTLEYVNKLGEKFGLKFEMPTDFKDLQTYRKNIQKVIETLKMKGYEKAAIELELKIAEGNQDKLEKQIEKQLKELADRISRTKTAKEFYDKILAQTGDVNLATRVSMTIYGDTGEGLFDTTVEQIKEAFKTGSEERPIDIDISAAIDVTNQRINYKTLADIYARYQDEMGEKARDVAQKIISEGQKTAAENILTWEKELAKAKDFEQQRTDIINRETQRRAEIIKSNLPQEDKNRLVSLSYDKQAKDLADLDVKEFRGSEDFIKMFENLDNVATSSLKRMREEIKRVIETDKDMSPENMKAMVDALEKIDEQISGRGFGNEMIQSVKDYIQATKNLQKARTELKAAQAEYKAQEPQLDADIATAKQEKDAADTDVVEKERVLLEIKRQEAILREQEIIDETQLAILQENELQANMDLVAAQGRQNIAASNVAKAEEKKAKAAKKVKKAEKEVTDEQDKQKKATSNFFKDLQQAAQAADQLAGELEDIKDLLGIASDSAAGVVFDAAIEGLQTMSKIIGIITAAQILLNTIAATNPIIAIATAILAIGAALTSWISGNKVRKANEEIEKQQEIIDQLEYSYERLEKAAEKAFGGNYIKNFKDQQKNLQAQIEATQKQLAAEQSKGKKADDDKIKELKESIRDLKDELADMQGTLSEQILGADLTSAARDFAKAWLDAYKEFSNTTDAMSEKFQEMVENMVVEGAMAAVMERALQPMFDMIDKMDDNDFYSEDFWREVSEKAAQGAKDADAGASTLMNFLEKAGISIRDLGGDLTGISRDIASASEESINGLAAGINTQNYYMSYVPQIAEHVAAMRAILEGGGAPIQSGQGVTDLITLQNQSLTHLQAINQHTAETVTECRRIAERCTAMAEDIHRVVVPKGTKGNYAIQTQVS